MLEVVHFAEPVAEDMVCDTGAGFFTKGLILHDLALPVVGRGDLRELLERKAPIMNLRLAS